MIRKISEKRLKKGERLAWNSTIKAKSYTLKKSPIRKVSKKAASLWAEARRICLNKFGHKCLLCGATGELHVHHWEETRTQNPSRKYDQSNLVPLCPCCHNHNGADERFFRLKERITKKLQSLHAEGCLPTEGDHIE